jgi:hypothetical protein
MLMAKELPHCHLSRHLERRLEEMMRHERGQRALQMGIMPNQVPVSPARARASPPSASSPPSIPIGPQRAARWSRGAA